MATEVLPFIFRASGWGGNDGTWSTFEISVGTPPQSFQVLPSTSTGEIWVPLPEGCDASIPDCAASRGVEFLNGSQSAGFEINSSSTWQQVGIYDLNADNNLYDSGDAALYGVDSVRLGPEDGPLLVNQTVGGISSFNFWMGILGLGVQAGNFSNLEQTSNTVVSSLQKQDLSSSYSYGYSVGAAYLNDTGGIVVGGYDRAAFEPSNIQFKADFAGSRSLTVGLKTLVVTNTLQDTISPPIDTAGLNMSIDSTVAQIWLPETICDALSDALGLMFDEGTQLYFINSSARENLISSDPVFTFTLAVDGSSNETTNIALPYAAFDQQIGQPWAVNDTTYFPIRRAANESQFVLGRTFLQEAYLVVDWERQNFTLGQSKHTNGASPDIVPIMPLPPESGNSGELGTGAKVGIGVGIVGILVVIVAVPLVLWRRKTKDKKKAAGLLESQENTDYSGDNKYPEDSKQQEGELTELPSHPATSDIDMLTKYGSELESPDPKSEAELRAMNRHEMASPDEGQSSGRQELEGTSQAQQLMSSPVYELAGHDAAQEMESEPQRGPGRLVENDRENETPVGTLGQPGSTLDRLGW